MSDQNDVNILDPNKFFKISGQVVNIRERVYNENKTKYVMIEDVSNADYPNYFEVEFYKDKALLVDAVKPGDFVTCNINFGGRKWTDQNTGEVKGAFFSLKGWKIEVQSPNQAYQQGQHPQHQQPVYTPPQHQQTPHQAFAQEQPMQTQNPQYQQPQGQQQNPNVAF